MSVPGAVRAAVMTGRDEPLAIRELTLRPVGPAEVRVRIDAAGVCHSDLSYLNGTLATELPIVLGHEAAGVIVECGTDVSRAATGDRVVVNWAPPCRQCWFCLHDEPWLCERPRTSADPIGTLDDGTPVRGVMGVGAFAEEVVVDAAGVVPLPPDVPIEVGALLGCAVLTGVGAVRNTARVAPTETVAVIGLGGVGLSAVAGAKAAGASPVIAIDRAPDKEPLAKAMGADHFIVASDTLAKDVRALTGGRGPDHVFECVGRPETIRQSWSLTSRGGRCTLVGVGSREDQVTFNALELFHFARTFGSCVYGSSDPDRDVPILAAAVLSGELPLGALVTDRIDLEGLDDAFERMKAGIGARSVVVFERASDPASGGIPPC